MLEPLSPCTILRPLLMILLADARVLVTSAIWSIMTLVSLTSVFNVFLLSGGFVTMFPLVLDPGDCLVLSSAASMGGDMTP